MIEVRKYADSEYPEISSESTSSTEFEVAIYAVIEVLKDKKLNVEDAKEVLKQVESRIDIRLSEMNSRLNIDDIVF